LRLLLGDQDFFSLLEAYANDPQLVHGSVVTTDFIRLAEEFAGRSLDHFFTPWLQTQTVARLHTDVEIHPRGEVGAVHFNFQQLQDVWLEMAIPVKMHCGTGDTELVLVMNQRSQQFTLNLDCPVDSVTVDPEGLVFMEQASAGARFINVVGPWPNPFDSQGAEFRIYLLERSAVSLKIYDARGRLVQDSAPVILEATGPAGDEQSIPQVWQFAPESGLPLAAGVYWFEFKTTGHRQVIKATFVH